MEKKCLFLVFLLTFSSCQTNIAEKKSFKAQFTTKKQSSSKNLKNTENKDSKKTFNAIEVKESQGIHEIWIVYALSLPLMFMFAYAFK